MRKLLGPSTIVLALILPATAGASIGPLTPGSSVDSNTPGRAQNYQNTSSATNAVNQLSVYLDASSTGSKVELGLYRSGGRLADCLITAPVANAWNRCTFPAVSVTQGTTYYTSILQPRGTSGVITYRNDGNHGRTWGSASSTLTALPTSWSNGPDWGSQTASIYANQSDVTSAPSSSPAPPPADSDGDGVPDSTDQCPGTPAGTRVDSTGCPVQAAAPPPPSSSSGTGDGVQFPNESTTGTPAGWTPSVARSTDMTVNTAGAVVQNIRFTNGASLSINASNVTVKDDEFQGGGIDTSSSGVLIEDTTFDRIAPETTGGEAAIAYCGYTALRVKLLDRSEGFREGCDAGGTTIQDSFARITPPDACNTDPNFDWHGDGIQGYNGVNLHVNNVTIDFRETTPSGSFCGGTSPFFYVGGPGGNPNGHAFVNGLLLKGGGETFRLGTKAPNSVQGLRIVDRSWRYTPIDVYTSDGGGCAAISPWDAKLVQVDSNWKVTQVDSTLSCTNS